MNIQQAKDQVFQSLNTLSDSGLRYEVSASNGQNIDRIVAKYDGNPNLLSKNQWCRVRFYPTTEQHTEALKSERDRLSQLGIGFDTGAGCDGSRDWEIDWSLRIMSPKEISERNVEIDIMDNIVDQVFGDIK